jgi:drug/metabolite transporter (DMT)-like permease
MNGSTSIAAPLALMQRERQANSAALASTAFVLLWSTGYIAGKFALAHAAAFNLLTVRFAGATLAFALLAVIARAAWPAWRAAAHSAVVGVLSLALSFGGVYLGVEWGAEIGVAALVVGAMPLLTAAIAPWFGECVSVRQWFGLAVGLGGVLLVLADRLHIGAALPSAYLMLVVGLIGISLGTLYQKRHASAIDPRAGLAIQHAAAALAVLPFALHEGLRFDGSAALAASTAWLIVVNSVGGFGLLFLLLRRGAANRVAQLFFLIPPVTAVMSHVVLGEQFTLLKLLGFIVAAAGVYIGTRPAAGRPA